MNVLALDVSTKTGWAYFKDGELEEYGLLCVKLVDFDVNKRPEKSDSYPFNIVQAANDMANKIFDLCKDKYPDLVVIENTVRGKNRHTQRLLEFIHKSTLDLLWNVYKIEYLDPSQWRSVLKIVMTNEDKKNNRLVSQGKKRGRVTKKHLSVRKVNSVFGLSLKIKDNDISDAICLGKAFYEKKL